MKPILPAFMMIAGALGGCAGIPGLSGDPQGLETLKAINAHIETCERHYQGGLGVGAAFTFRIDCPPAQGLKPRAVVGEPEAPPS
jgi:hypothetical protein